MRKAIYRNIKKIIALNIVFLMLVTQISGSFKVYANQDITRTPTGTVTSTGCGYTVTVNGITYKHYFQGQGPYAGNAYAGGTMKNSGCSVTSVANVLTGYGLDITPEDIRSRFYGAMINVSDTLASYGVPGKWYDKSSDSEYVQLIEEAFAENKPVIIRIHSGHPTFSTGSSGHYMALAGIDQDGNIQTLDPARWSSPERHVYHGSLSSIASVMKRGDGRGGVWIPDNTPEGGTVTPPPDSRRTTEGAWHVTTGEVPDLDNLGEFEFPGNPKGMSFSPHTITIDWIFSQLGNFLDYILGALFTIVKAAIIGTIENIENFLNDLILSIEGKQGEDIHYTIEDLVYNRVPAFNPMLLSGMKEDGSLGEPIASIQKLVAGWYVSIRNLSLLVIFIMLIYTGIRMAFSQISEKKANYKQQLLTWFKCLAIVFILHYIIFFIFWMNGVLVDVFNPGSGGDENLIYNTIKTRAYDLRLSVGFTGAVMYITLFVFWIKFLIIYTRRLLRIITLIVTAPFVIARYALDNATAKGKKAFEDWIYEFTSNVFIQSLHALEYTIFVAIAVDIALESIIGFIIALIFMSQILALDETILGIIRFRGHDLGKKIKPLKQKLDVNTLIDVEFAKATYGTAAGIVSAGASGIGRFGKFVNTQVKDTTGKDFLGEGTKVRNDLLNKKDNLLRRTIGRLDNDYDERLKLQIQSRELDKKNKSTYQANIAKRELKKYKKEKEKRYKTRKDQFFKRHRLLQLGLGTGQATIGLGVMPINFAVGSNLAFGAAEDTYKSIKDHDSIVSEYDKNIKKTEELEDTIKTVNRSNQLEDEIDTTIYNMKNPKEQKKAIQELKRLSEIDSNNKFVENVIKDYMFRNNIDMITDDNIDEILTDTLDEIDSKGIITTSERKAIIKAEKRKLKENAKEKFDKDLKEGKINNLYNTDLTMSEEEKIAKHRKQYQSRFEQGDVAKMFTSTVQENLVSKENAFLGDKVNELKDINFTSKNKNKRSMNNTKMFMENLGNRYMPKEG